MLKLGFSLINHAFGTFTFTIKLNKNVMIAQTIRKYLESQTSEVKKACKLCKKFKDILKVYKHYNQQLLRDQIYSVSHLINTLKKDFGYVPDKVYTICAKLTQKLNNDVACKVPKIRSIYD